MSNIGTLPGERLAGLSADLFHKIQKEVITLDELALFNQRKNPFAEVEVRKDADAFFRTRKGLYVWNDFRNLVVAKATSSSESHVVATKSIVLERDMSDAKIEKMLGDGDLFTEDQLCDTLAEMIEKQEGGKEGKLLNNGCANLFYLRSCVVYVYWGSGNREWRVFTWFRVGIRWRAGLRVFSPATGS